MCMIVVSCLYNSPPPIIFIIFSILHLSSGLPINRTFTSEGWLFHTLFHLTWKWNMLIDYFFIRVFFLNIGMIVKNITVFFTINAMILESTVTTFFRYECNGEDCSFTHKRPSHRVFRKKVKGNGKNVYL